MFEASQAHAPVAPKRAHGLTRWLSLLHPRANAEAFVDAVQMLVARRQIILSMAMREISSKYAGQFFGRFWAIGHPLFQTAMMLFIFAVVFKTKIGGTYDMPRDYTVYMLAGLTAWLSMSPMLAASATSVVSNANLIKQFTFDARVSPVKDVLACFVAQVVSMFILVVYTIAAYGSIPWTYVLIPFVVAIHFLIALGCAWALSSIAVFLRDVKDFVQVMNAAMIYALPIVYLPSWIPELLRPAIYLNPFSYLIWVYQDVFYFGRIEHPWAWMVATAFGIFIFVAGYRLFRRLQPSFGSLL